MDPNVKTNPFVFSSDVHRTFRLKLLSRRFEYVTRTSYNCITMFGVIGTPQVDGVLN